MIFKIHSNSPLSDAEIDKIKGILEESDCPNESLRSTFNEYDHMEAEHIYFNKSFWDHKVEISCTPKASLTCR